MTKFAGFGAGGGGVSTGFSARKSRALPPAAYSPIQLPVLGGGVSDQGTATTAPGWTLATGAVPSAGTFALTAPAPETLPAASRNCAWTVALAPGSSLAAKAMGWKGVLPRLGTSAATRNSWMPASLLPAS